MDNKANNFYAFTLAEVLITLAIIGVVASLTIPNVIANIKKNTIEKKLISTYSALSNALRMAEAYNGGMSNWDLREYQDAHDADNESVEYREKRVRVFDTYLMPYLRTVNKSAGELKSLKSLGYKTPWTTPNGDLYLSIDGNAYPIIMQNGTVLIPRSGYYKKGEEKYFKWINLYVDLDGPRGNNVIGKDIFVFAIPLKSGFELAAWGEYTRYDEDTKTFQKSSYSQDEMLEKCKMGDANAVFCTYFIKRNSWKFPKDYPWI